MSQHPFVSVQTFDNCTAAYETHPKRLLIDNGQGEQTLKAITFSKEHLLEILNQQGVEELSVFFAVRPDNLNHDPERQYFTVMMAGISGDNDVITAKVLDWGKNCPTLCPKR